MHDLTRLFAQTLRLSARLQAAGGAIAATEGLSAARWQVMGAISAAPLPVAEIARRQEVARQGVQRIADELVAARLAEYHTNPAHARAKLLALSAEGRATHARLKARQRDWTEAVAEALAAEGFGPSNTRHLATMLATVRQAMPRPAPAKDG